MKASLIILFRNEVEIAEKIIEATHSYLSDRKLAFEIIAVDDSSDGTWEILKKFAAKHEEVVAVKGGSPPGYGRALKTGFRTANGDILIPFNGDFSDSLKDVEVYIQLIEEGYDMVFGSRFAKGAQVEGSEWLKSSVSRLGNAFVQLLFRAPCSDLTNSFKAYRKEVINELNITSDGYDISMEIALKAIRRNYSCIMVPISWKQRELGQSKMSIIRAIPRFLNTALRTRFTSLN